MGSGDKEGFEWGEEQSTAFVNTKKAIIDCTTTQGYFSDTHKTTLFTDGSPTGLGAALVQEDENGTPRIISFASKSLTPTEKRYAQTQREALAVVWAAEHFWYFLVGRRFTIRTDAQGIHFIFKRDRSDTKRVMSRADGWALRLSAYDFDIEYVKGKFNIADSPSRLAGGDDEPYEEGKAPCEIGAISSILDESNPELDNITLKDIREATSNDKELQAVLKALESEEWTDEIGAYKKIKESLATQNGILVKDGRVVIPVALRQKALTVAHEGHPGMSAMKSILRARTWWPGMNKSIEQTVEQCKGCKVTGRRGKPAPMSRTILPESAWEALAIDFNGPYARYGGIYIFVVVDVYSRYVCASIVKATSYEAVRTVFEQLFNRFGYPARIKSDNGPPFNGEQYKEYCIRHGIEAQFSTPLCPRQNGLAEIYMKIVNKAMVIASMHDVPYEVELAKTIRAHNSAAHRVTGIPPEQLMFGRKLRRGLPLLGPASAEIDKDALRKRDEAQKSRAKTSEDSKRQAKPPILEIGDRALAWKHTRGKGDPKYDPTPYKVVSMKGATFGLIDEAGRKLTRNTMDVTKWTGEDEKSETEEKKTAGATRYQMEPSQLSKRFGKQPDATELRRSEREKRIPEHLNEYVRFLETQK